MTRLHEVFFRRICALIMISLLIISACGQRTTNSPSDRIGSPSEKSAEHPPSTVTEQTSSKSSPENEKVIMSLAVKTLAYAPVLIAESKGYFEEEGIDIEIVLVGGGGPAIQAVVGGTAQFGAVDTSAVTISQEKGADILAVQANYTRMTQDLILSENALQQIGLEENAPVQEKFKALKGLTLGVTSPGAASDVFTRYYLRRGGLEPEKDTRILTIGGVAELVAALKNGQVDGFMVSPPQPQQLEAEGIGKVFISGSKVDVEGLDDFPYTVVVTRKSYAESHPQITEAIARAVARANNLMLDQPDEALAVLAKIFDTIEPEILSASLMTVSSAVPRDGKMTEQGWRNKISVDSQTGTIKKELNPTEGVMWTNRFLKEVN